MKPERHIHRIIPVVRGDHIGVRDILDPVRDLRCRDDGLDGGTIQGNHNIFLPFGRYDQFSRDLSFPVRDQPDLG